LEDQNGDGSLMISIETIEQEIIELERKDTSYAVVERLAWLYIVRDHLNAPDLTESTGELIGGEFAQACSNVPMQGLIEILAEHMDGIRALYPREYEAILRKIKQL